MRTGQKKPSVRASHAGLAARELAVHLIAGVLMHKRPLEHVLAEQSARPEHAADQSFGDLGIGQTTRWSRSKH